MEEVRNFLSQLEQAYADKYVSFSELENLKKQMPPVPKTWETRKIRQEINFYLKKRKKLNRKFIKQKQQETFEIEGNQLDPQQIAAVVACEDAELILASAGSGKSASLLAKVNYIVKDLGVPAENVLVIAFTRKVVEELKDRMKGSGVEICTFHSFGNQIILNADPHKNLKLVPDGFFEKVMKKILDSMVQNKTLKPDFIKDFGDLDSLQKLLIATLQLQKNEQISFQEFYARIMKMKNDDEREKAQKFYSLYIKVVKIYSQILREQKLYDFSDMLNWATRLIQKMPQGTLKYQYILVDEVQDLSLSKSLLLQAILNNCENVKLFAVGDDWQSIYRFAGSNLGVLNDFEKTFGRATYRGVIRRTYRFGQPTAWVSEYFIRKNPHQSKKKVQTFKKTKTPIELCLSYKTNAKIPADYTAVNTKIQELYEEFGEVLFDQRVQVISRYNRDIFRLVTPEHKAYGNARIVEEREDGIILNWKIEKLKKNLEVSFCSMHKSKGITRDIVFVVNMNEGDKGMPSTRADDPILGMMLAKPDPYPLAEERRLFYVAITRATTKTILVSDAKKISRFVREIAKNLGSDVAEMIA